MSSSHFHAIVAHDVAGLVDERSLTEGEHEFGIAHRDVVLQLEPADAFSGALHREGGAISSNAHADAFGGIRAEIALREPLGCSLDLGHASFANDEEFSFNLQGFCIRFIHAPVDSQISAAWRQFRPGIEASRGRSIWDCPEFGHFKLPTLMYRTIVLFFGASIFVGPSLQAAARGF
jgi:hypothetical protein